MPKSKLKILVMAAISIIVLTVFSMDRFAQLDTAKAAAADDKKLDRILSNQNRIMRVLSKVDTDLGGIKHDVRQIKNKVD